jgi:alkanesulfonate monooxygenase SsuD/methylene tetrahydromethanopterin reductase-like flavin-dependent oxidoreductase (luciferase family)
MVEATPRVVKWTKHTVARHLAIGGLGATLVGTPSQVADEFRRWVEEADVDGFNMVSYFSNIRLGFLGTPTEQL